VNFFIKLIVFFFIQGLLQLTCQETQAKKLTFVRDAETESGIRALITPLLQSANLENNSVNIYIVNDPTLNAFVAGGPNIFLHTGLLATSGSASQLIGVLAHEIGHISGGHLSKLAVALKLASNEALVGTILGGAASILLGKPSAGTAIVSGGRHVGIRNLLRFSRTQELSADRAAIRYLDATKQSAQGMLDFMELLQNQELLSVSNQDPYVRTHPPTQQRTNFLQNYIKESPYSNVPSNKHFREIHGRIKAKIRAFIQPPHQTLREFPASDESVNARYAKTIANHRIPDQKAALSLIDGLVAELPNNPYFHELKGQILFENGYAKKALLPYEKAVELLPSNALFRADLGRVQLELNDLKLLPRAITNFQISLEKEPQRPFIWKQLGITFGRLNMIGKSSRALAESALLKGLRKEAIRLAKKAKKYLPKHSPSWIRAEDIIIAAQNIKRKR
jgi:predicted Zn-dependent protease